MISNIKSNYKKDTVVEASNSHWLTSPAECHWLRWSCGDVLARLIMGLLTIPRTHRSLIDFLHVVVNPICILVHTLMQSLHHTLRLDCGVAIETSAKSTWNTLNMHRNRKPWLFLRFGCVLIQTTANNNHKDQQCIHWTLQPKQHIVHVQVSEGGDNYSDGHRCPWLWVLFYLPSCQEETSFCSIAL